MVATIKVPTLVRIM